jgi:hypothetical protein
MTLEDRMKKSPLLLLILGLALLAIGGFLTLNGEPPSADPAMVTECQERVRGQGAAMLAKCQEQAFAAGMTATDANEAAQAISAANNAEVGGNMLGMFLLGLGVVLTIFGGGTWRQMERAKGR